MYDLQRQLPERLEQFASLSTLDRAVIRMMALLFVPVRMDELQALCKLAEAKGLIESARDISWGRLTAWKETGLVVAVGNNEWKVADELRESLVRELVRGPDLPAWRSVVGQLEQRGRYQHQNSLRAARLAFYTGDYERLGKLIAEAQRNSSPLFDQLVKQVIDNPFDRTFVEPLPTPIREGVLNNLADRAIYNGAIAPDALALLMEGPVEDPYLALSALHIDLLRGNRAAAARWLGQFDERRLELYRLNARAAIAFFGGETDEAVDTYRQLLKKFRSLYRKKKLYFSDLAGLLFALASIQQARPEELDHTLTNLEIASDQYTAIDESTYSMLKFAVMLQQGEQGAATLAQASPPAAAPSAWSVLIAAFCRTLSPTPNLAPLAESLRAVRDRAAASGLVWFEMQAAAFLATVQDQADSPDGTRAAELHRTLGGPLLTRLVVIRPRWELALQKLEHHLEGGRTTKAGANELRLAWFVSHDKRTGRYQIQPREQKLGAKGWSSGRNVALKRLRETELPYMTLHDKAVCRHIVMYGYPNQYAFEPEAIVALVGHPLVFWEESRTPLEVVQGEPEVRVKKSRDKLSLALDPSPRSGAAFDVVRDSPTRLKVVRFDAAHTMLSEILAHPIDVPLEQESRVQRLLGPLSGRIRIHSDIGGGGTAKTVAPDSRSIVQLSPAGDGLKVAIVVRPLGDGGPVYPAGAGGKIVMGEIEGKQVQTERDLKGERKQVRDLVSTCATLSEHPSGAINEWVIEDLDDCLTLLTELDAHARDQIIEWPEGQPFSVTRTTDAQRLSLKIERKRDWFAVDGELQVADDLVLGFKALLDLIQTHPGRFVPLGEGRFLALTDAFRRRLEDMHALGERHGGKVSFHPLATPALAALTEDVGEVAGDKDWRAQLQRLEASEQIDPQPPSTFQGGLRDYQLDGYRWLMGLAHWGAGACLADDMGLGKTIQTLVLILTRAPEGPSLVVAPTSVTMNWQREAERFAPTLKLHELGSGDREQLIESLGAYDVLITTYGLLQQDETARMLGGVTWQTIVLDEAQAIKNPGSKRAKAAFALQGHFKMTTTGTPIENRLLELWSLFRFINPGLLGSMDGFNRRFAAPIERDEDAHARQRLKRLVHPFILRRLKSQVLDELPGRTEITLQAEPSAEERAFYEALRRGALERIASDAADDKRFLVLAEIMRLRRACCDTRLIDPSSTLPSTKAGTFMELVEELIAGGHKALVFSQFVDHLQLLRSALEAAGIGFHYLDGSTPAKQRKAQVDAFQAGEGDLFLISLKAGGTGLNLTAADYVIHMDPWWNPAVEDQASDRAHRIGQQRPVTIYRLVTQGTIEEQIVELHAHKRNLAEGLLAGSDTGERLSAEDLIKLISEAEREDSISH